MSTFVLVAGAWLGGWVWRSVVPPLREHQHTVYTPTLTGLGERVHLASPDVDLDVHITDVANLIEFEALQDVILVGHSYSGMVVTGVADRIPSSIKHLVYLDAILPEDGQCFFDHWSDAGRAAVEEEARLYGEGWKWPLPSDVDQFSNMSDFSADDRSWFEHKARPQPLRTLSKPLRFSHESTSLLRSYILCTTAQRDQFPDYVDAFRSDKNWGFYELPSGHWPMITTPKKLADILLEIANAALDRQEVEK